jgi:hypothetical protein
VSPLTEQVHPEQTPAEAGSQLPVEQHVMPRHPLEASGLISQFSGTANSLRCRGIAPMLLGSATRRIDPPSRVGEQTQESTGYTGRPATHTQVCRIAAN